jgi:hypothetical protein
MGLRRPTSDGGPLLSSEHGRQVPEFRFNLQGLEGQLPGQFRRETGLQVDQDLGISPMAQLAPHTAKSTVRFAVLAVSAIFTLACLPQELQS